ncbi:MAG: hypothetical protein QNJ97_17780 [Myxococcota bacterium]|nr:hypothetical protein [Myxococcota bacterium]
MKLLNIDANPKTVKGQKQGYMTAVLYLAPFTAAGINVCPMAELAGCVAACLNTAGRGGIAKGGATFAPHGTELPDNAVQRARVARTRLYAEYRDAFMRQLERELHAFVRKAARAGLVPAARLNGTSDIVWERVPVDSSHPDPRVAATIFDLFPDVQFYDYTKLPKRFARPLPANYHLSLSYSEASKRYAALCFAAAREHDAPLAMVTRKGYTADCTLPWAAGETMRQRGECHVVDGDAHDLRFLDPPGAVVILRAKGRARKDTTGFVID